jgi:hypothetical protein
MLRPDLLRIGFCFALLALAGQLAWGATLPDPALAQLGLGVICHAGEAGSAPRAPLHHAPCCALCPLCAAIAMPAPALAKPPSLTLPRVVAIARAVILPPAIASPATILAAAQPRAPPALA